MYGFCRLGVIPAPSSSAGCVANGLATNDDEEREERRDGREHGHDPHDEVARPRAIQARPLRRRTP